MNSYYELLGLRQDATEMEIRSAYGRDVLRLQETASEKVSQFRATLDAAFATLIDPAKRTAYDASLVTATQDATAAAGDETADAFRYARNGGLWFAGGGRQVERDDRHDRARGDSGERARERGRGPSWPLGRE